jgi:RHS repeat-associated protein
MNSSGGLESHVGYHAYGKMWRQSATPATDRLFTGHQQMGAKSGTYYANARFYSADIGRFPQPDALVSGGYGYAANNPINNTDPTGNFVTGVTPCLCSGGLASGDTGTGGPSDPDSILPPLLEGLIPGPYGGWRFESAWRPFLYYVGSELSDVLESMKWWEAKIFGRIADLGGFYEMYLYVEVDPKNDEISLVPAFSVSFLDGDKVYWDPGVGVLQFS